MYDLDYFDRWDQTRKDDRPAYVTTELRRIVRDGRPLLTTVLRHPDADVSTAALSLITAGVTEMGDPVFEGGAVVASVRLRLHADAKPPERDPQNRALPPAERGNVLVVKLGNKGGRLGETAPPKVVEQFSGERRRQMVQGGASLYETEKVGRSWRAYPLRTALLILRTWGVGVQVNEHLSHVDRNTGDLVIGQSFYLVEEDAQDKAALLGEERPSKPSKPAKDN